MFRILALEYALGGVIVACGVLWFIWSARQMKVLRADWETIRKASAELRARAIQSFEMIYPEDRDMARTADPTQYVSIKVPVGARMDDEGKTVPIYASAKVPVGITTTDVSKLSNAIAGLAIDGE